MLAWVSLFVCMVYFIIYTPFALTFSFILSPLKFNLFYKEFSGDDGPKDALDFEVKDGYTIIGWNDFDACVSLKTIKLPKSIKSISTGTFHNCSLLQKIDLPPSLTTLGICAFKNC